MDCFPGGSKFLKFNVLCLDKTDHQKYTLSLVKKAIATILNSGLIIFLTIMSLN